jgi:hypothetical protein
VKRSWHQLGDVHIKEDGTCQYCGYKIAGVFKRPALPSRADIQSLRHKVEALQGTNRVI